MAAASDFRIDLVRSDTQMKLRSVCLKCGEERIVSVMDGSLEQWHDGHQCKKQLQPDERNSAQAGFRPCSRASNSRG